MNELPSISVVVPTYQRRADLPRFVEALLAQAELDELVVAVDGSTDGTVEWLQELAREDPRINVLDLPNRGAAAARQSGLEAARGDVVLLMDHDVVAEPGLVAGHRAHHGDGRSTLVLGYMPNDWQSLAPGHRGPALLYRRAYEAQCARYATEPSFVMESLWGGNFSLLREEFLRVGFADVERQEDRGGEEDREFGLRCLKAGIVGCFDPQLKAKHEYDRSFAQYRRDCWQAGRSRRAMYEAHADTLGSDLQIGHSLPGPLRSLWARLARDPAFPVMARVFEAIFKLGVRLQSVPLEAFGARGVGSLEVERGSRATVSP